MLPGSDISLDVVYRQADQLLLSVVEALNGPVELEMVRALLELRVALEQKGANEDEWAREVEAARDAAINVVNNFFYEKLSSTQCPRSAPTSGVWIHPRNRKSYQLGRRGTVPIIH